MTGVLLRALPLLVILNVTFPPLSIVTVALVAAIGIQSRGVRRHRRLAGRAAYEQRRVRLEREHRRDVLAAWRSFP